ncbi:MAG: DMT family transporter [Magnetococcales bacterium]|nr:DMT family transporter [Magnetococcales bacterium]
MPIGMAFLAVTFIWGSTPMAIQWSQIEVGYQFAVTARMAIGTLMFLLLLPWLKRHPAPPGRVLLIALVSGSSMFLSMFCVYWGARFVPSGWISVLFGLGPMMTGILAAAWLGEPFPPTKQVGSLLGVGGLMLFFFHGERWGEHVLIGIGAILLSVLIYVTGNIAIKRWNQNISPLWVAAGSLWVAFPLFLLSLLLSDAPWPTHIGLQSAASILYLGVVANVAGFICFYYLLSRVSAANATLVTLTAPAVALWVGTVFNREEIHGGLMLGTLLILGGLSLFQWGVPWTDNHSA